MERDTYERIKADKSNFIVIEFPNVNTSVVKTEEESSEILAMSEPFEAALWNSLEMSRTIIKHFYIKKRYILLQRIQNFNFNQLRNPD
jgi:hypothetical protein